MRITKKQTLTFSVLFAITELIFLVLIQTVGGRINEIISFASVVLAFLFSLLTFSHNESAFTVTALLFTVISDLFLVIIKPQYKLVAMIFFSVAQLSYFLRLYFVEKREGHRRIHLTVRALAILLAIILTVTVLGERTDALSLVSMFYFANLFVNLLYAFIYIKSSVLFPFGLLCFILCDILVGLSVMDGMYVSFAADSFIYKLIHTDINLIWLFYVPSQTLIAISEVERSLRKKNNENTKRAS